MGVACTAEDQQQFLAGAPTASAKGEVCACDLVEPSARSQPTVSHHMKILVDAGLVSREKRGLWVWYAAVPGRLDALRNALR
jgi:ArsR family transcriptional regulator, arsenate/arsenite/antimonite-responsive transcriptional repressor